MGCSAPKWLLEESSRRAQARVGNGVHSALGVRRLASTTAPCLSASHHESSTAWFLSIHSHPVISTTVRRPGFGSANSRGRSVRAIGPARMSSHGRALPSAARKSTAAAR